MHHDIVTAARGWIGTRFHHQGRLKKSDTGRGGVDCLGLLIGVADELNLPFSQYDETNYPHYPDTQRLKEKLAKVMKEVSKDSIEAGDILLLSMDGNPQHLGIVGKLSDELSIIHAYAPARGVVEHTLDEWWLSKIVAVYRV